MDPASTAAIVAVTVSVIGGLASGYAALKQRSTENMSVVLTAMQSHMGTLAAENTDLRVRVTDAERRVAGLISDVARCNNDKRVLELQLAAVNRRMDEINGGA